MKLFFAFFILMASTQTANAGYHFDTAKWKLVWSDEFDGPDGSQPDPKKWTIEVGPGIDTNNELQYNTNSPKNNFIEDHHLVIRALHEPYTDTQKRTREYSSGRMTSAGLFQPTYGRFESRMKLPRGQGFWTAFWLMGVCSDPWPDCGEVDIAENSGNQPGTINSTLHGPRYSRGEGIGKNHTLKDHQNYSDDYHVFAMEWEKNSLRFFVDDDLFLNVSKKDIPVDAKWVFDHAFFMVINFAVGGFWPGPPDGTTIFPQELDVDYVRVYSR